MSKTKVTKSINLKNMKEKIMYKWFRAGLKPGAGKI